MENFLFISRKKIEFNILFPVEHGVILFVLWKQFSNRIQCPWWNHQINSLEIDLKRIWLLQGVLLDTDILVRSGSRYTRLLVHFDFSLSLHPTTSRHLHRKKLVRNVTRSRRILGTIARWQVRETCVVNEGLIISNNRHDPKQRRRIARGTCHLCHWKRRHVKFKRRENTATNVGNWVKLIINRSGNLNAKVAGCRSGVL